MCVDATETVYLQLGKPYIVNESTAITVTVEDNGYNGQRRNMGPYVANRFKLYEEKPNTVDEPATENTKSKAMTLPTDSKTRKNYPLLAGCVRYFPAALAGVALISKLGNDKHNPGEQLHHARSKSMDHGDCILRHLIDTEDLLAEANRTGNADNARILEEASQMAWRALAYSQELHERFGAPLAPGAKK